MVPRRNHSGLPHRSRTLKSSGSAKLPGLDEQTSRVGHGDLGVNHSCGLDFLFKKGEGWPEGRGLGLSPTSQPGTRRILRPHHRLSTLANEKPGAELRS